MGRGNCTYKQRDLEAAIRAAKKSGGVARVEVKPDGTIVVVMGEPSAIEPQSKGSDGEWL